MSFDIVKSWDSFLFSFRSELYDVYFEEKYVKLYEADNEEAVCFIYEEDEKRLLFPFLRRKFVNNGKTYYDFETAYGYGGPIYNNSNPDFIVRGLIAFRKYCVSNNYVAGYTRFHPLLNNYKSFNSIGQVLFNRHTIAIDLTLSANDIWMNEIHAKNRNTIKKGIKSGLEFIVDTDFNYIKEFVKLYEMTMSRVDADSFYYFQPKYYQSFKNNIPNSFIGLVSFEGRIISGAIFYYSKDYGHYHLSGSDINYSFLSPNNFMLYEASKVMKSLGVKMFHLGGGFNSEEDNPLYMFKSRFSRSKYDYNIGKAIFNADIYNMICDEWVINNPDKQGIYANRLLKYKY